MPTVFDVLLQAARNLEALWEGEVDSGNTTTVVDGELAESAGAGFTTDDEWNGGVLFIPYTTDGLAPYREVRRINDYAGASGTFTVTALSAAVAAGDRYAACGRRYPLMQMYAKLNESLWELGDVPTDYIYSTFKTAADTRKYAIPNEAKRAPKQLFIARADAEPYDWEAVTQWTVKHADPNTTAYVEFPYQPVAEMPLKLIYMAPHARVAVAADYISEYLSADWLALDVALRLARWRLHQPGADPETQVSLINDLMQRKGQLAGPRRPEATPARQVFPYLPD